MRWRPFVQSIYLIEVNYSAIETKLNYINLGKSKPYEYEDWRNNFNTFHYILHFLFKTLNFKNFTKKNI